MKCIIIKLKSWKRVIPQVLMKNQNNKVKTSILIIMTPKIIYSLIYSKVVINNKVILFEKNRNNWILKKTLNNYSFLINLKKRRLLNQKKNQHKDHNFKKTLWTQLLMRIMMMNKWIKNAILKIWVQTTKKRNDN